ncbi:MAG: SurA N-terminal domain-containing protein [Pseudomonadota bacterium]|nr:SurA N-terminal domain-containing protein [Pseudomonadota bacterium]
MLRGIHTVSKNWIGRIVTGILLGLIAVSFTIWGVGDVFRGFGRSTLAKIGGTEIGIEQFRQTYNDHVQQLSRQIGRPIPSDQARALGLDRRLLGQLLAEAALDENARDLGLNLSDAEIAKRITSDNNFRGPTGQFDRVRFDQILRQAGYNEARYVAEQRRVSLRRQIADTVAGEFAPPKTALELQHRYINEERSVDYVALGPAQAGDIPQPSSEVIEKYYDRNKLSFRAPEYRKLDLVIVTPTELARWTDVSDADARKAYEERRARYVTPERREVQQIVFPNAEEAGAAAGRLSKGLTFAQLASERKLKDSDINLGMVPKAAIVDPTVSDAAFGLKPGATSEPVSGRFGTVLVHVGKVEPEKIRPYGEVAAEIKRDISLDRARAQIVERHDKIEDERSAGVALAEIAKQLGLSVRRIEAVDRSGRNPDGAPVADLPQGVDILSGAFASDVGAENEPLRAQGGGYVWYDVVLVTASRDRPLAEIKDKVIERWRSEEIAARLKAKAAELVDKLTGSSINDVAAAAGVKAQTAKGLKRGVASSGISANAMDEIFRAAKGNAGTAEGESSSERIVFRVTEVTIPKLDLASSDIKRIDEAARNSYVEEFLAQYITQLETDLGTTVNEGALNQALGGSSAN